jgi:hypothetical protein
MNWKQRIVVWAGTVLIVSMGVYPPWVQTWHFSDGNVRVSTYYWIFRFPEVPHWFARVDQKAAPDLQGIGTTELWRNDVDLARLLIQWAVVCFAVGGLVWSLRERRAPSS